MGAKQKNRGTTMRSRQDSRHIKRKFRGRGEARDLSKRKFRDLLNSFFEDKEFFKAWKSKFRGRGETEARNFSSFLGHFEVDVRTSETSGRESYYFLQFAFGIALGASLCIHLVKNLLSLSTDHYFCISIAWSNWGVR